MAFGDFSLSLSDPWSTDPVDPLARMTPLKRRPITDVEASSTLGSIANAGLAGLGWVGSTIDKTLGTRAIRAAVDTLLGSGQHASDILSVLPFSETLGITSPENQVSGGELLKNVTGYDPSQGTWAERNLVGPAVEIALDPSTYVGGIGALTEAGKLAKKTGALKSSFLESIGRGERNLIYGLTGPTTEAATRSVLGGIGKANEALTGLPGIGAPIAGIGDLLGKAGSKVKTTWGALFDPMAGGSYDPIIQEANRTARFPKQQEIAKDVLGTEMDLREAYRKIVPAGGDPTEYSQYLTQAIEGVPYDLRRVPTGATLPELTQIDQLAADMAGKYRPMMQTERNIGLPSAELTDPLIEYAHRHAIKAPAGTYSIGADRGAAEAALIGERQKILSGIPGGTVQIQEWAANPELAGAHPSVNRAARVARIEADLRNLGQFTPVTPEIADLLQNAPQHAEQIATFLEKVKPEYIAGVPGGRAGIPLFGMDPFEDLRIRGQAHAQRMGTAEGIWSVLKKYAQQGRGDRTIAEVLDSLNLGTTTGREGAVEEAARRFGIEVPANLPEAINRTDYLRGQLRNWSLPEDVAHSLLKEQTGYHIPEALQPVVAFTDWFQNLFKSSLYGPWPASHVRNLVSGEWENMMATPGFEGKIPFGRTSQEALDILRGGTPDLAIPGWEHLTPEEKAFNLRKEAYSRGLIGMPPGEMNEMIGKPLSTADRLNPATPFTQTAGEFLKEATAQPGAWNPLNMENFVPFKAGRQVGTNVENYLRLSQFNDLLQKGWTLDEAAKMVEKTHFNYGALSDVEKQVMKRIFPFYTFTRKNIPKQFERLLQEPLKQMAPIRLLAQGQLGDEGPGYIPQYMAGSLAIPMGPPSEAGVQQYLAGLGLPFEEAFGRIKGGVGPLSMAGRTFEGIMGMTSPFIKAPIEWGTGEQLFSGRELPTLAASNTLSTLFGEQAARPLNQLIANTPASRVLSTADRLVDMRKDPLSKLLSLMSGVNLTDVDMAKMRGRDIQDLVKRYLETTPFISESTDFYVSPKNRGKVSEEDLAVLDLQRWQQKQARKAKKLHQAEPAQ